MADRGQAEVVGYVLVFSAIVVTVGLVSIAGQAGLVDLRDTQRTAGVENGFSALADNVDDVVQGGAPSRATELAPSGGQLSLGEPVTVSVSATNSGVVVLERSETLRPVVYESPGGTTLVYATGAVVIRGEGGGTTMLREPRMRLESSRTIVPIVNTSLDRQQIGTATGSIDAQSRVLVRTKRNAPAAVVSTDRDVDPDRDVDLTITVDSPRATAWEPYLEAEIDPDADNCATGGGGTSVSCTYTTDRATVVTVPVGVSFEQ